MESNYHGVEKDEYYRRRAVEKKAMFDEIRRRSIETNAPTYTREEAFKMMIEIAMENRKEKERQNQQTPDTPNSTS